MKESITSIAVISMTNIIMNEHYRDPVKRAIITPPLQATPQRYEKAPVQLMKVSILLNVRVSFAISQMMETIYKELVPLELAQRVRATATEHHGAKLLSQ